ncbi:uncharacterized protein BDR25DRAFT_358862 [Lindgomyces ingoldianus]|uniref:Uncharacterized protein n=1 Tax=Lindgomyces ingoldianus TaxID=673940 RepID=A0ACB6QL61_9PLEO|nr:uncharacterized protein BDR25DRAFT_358862 [Lindgomyces ingoldianus]KAF2467318.1 hypothetical protein BDR25DRAFT_358862 [Lindgomyces ingoldianus]
MFLVLLLCPFLHAPPRFNRTNQSAVASDVTFLQPPSGVIRRAWRSSAKPPRQSVLPIADARWIPPEGMAPSCDITT